MLAPVLHISTYNLFHYPISIFFYYPINWESISLAKDISLSDRLVLSIDINSKTKRGNRAFPLQPPCSKEFMKSLCGRTLSCVEIEFLTQYADSYGWATFMATPLICGRNGCVGWDKRKISKKFSSVFLSDNMPAGWKPRNDQTSAAPGALIGPYLIVIKAPAATISRLRKRTTLFATYCA